MLSTQRTNFNGCTQQCERHFVPSASQAFWIRSPNMSRQFKTPHGSQRTSRDLRKHVQNHTYMINHVCIPLNTYVFWLKFFSFLFTVSLINFDLQSFNPSSVHVVSTAARSPDISSTWQPKRQAIQAVYAKGMMFLFLVHVYTTFTLRSHYIHTTFTLCSHYVHTTLFTFLTFTSGKDCVIPGFLAFLAFLAPPLLRLSMLVSHHLSRCSLLPLCQT